jgi:coenzyme F420-dependent glucose-6-phosphate dehydrogenase
MLTIGYKASAEQFGPKELLQFATLAEEVGFDSVAVSDHFQPWRHTDGHAPNAFAWLGAVAARTSTIRLGTSVATPTFRYHPALVAQLMATVGCLAPGRAFLGVGTGESMNERPLGIEWPDSKERFARLKESVELIQRLWREERVTFDGAYFKTRNATIYDHPDEPIPILIAASGPSAARLAGRVADGFICTSGKGMGLYRDELLPNVVAGAESANRAPAEIELMIEMKVSFESDVELAKQETLHWAALALSAEEKLDVEDPVEMERRAGLLSADRAASRWIVSVDPEEHVKKIDEYIQLGFRHLVFHAPGPDQSRFLRTYAAEILPRLRKIAVPAEPVGR